MTLNMHICFLDLIGEEPTTIRYIKLLHRFLVGVAVVVGAVVVVEAAEPAVPVLLLAVNLLQ
jgi:hypothetical protein